MLYTLVNGKKVKNLPHVFVGSVWEMSPYFLHDGEKVCEMLNTETGEVKWFSANGKEVNIF